MAARAACLRTPLPLSRAIFVALRALCNDWLEELRLLLESLLSEQVSSLLLVLVLSVLLSLLQDLIVPIACLSNLASSLKLRRR